MIQWQDFGPLILDLIKQAESLFDEGSTRHEWVVQQVLDAPFWPRWVPTPIRRAMAKWSVEFIFQMAIKGASSIFRGKDSEPGEPEIDESGRIVPKRIAATNPADLLALRVPAIRKAIATGHFDDDLSALGDLEREGRKRKGVFAAISERLDVSAR